MDYQIDLEFNRLCLKLEKDFEMDMDVKSLVFLIGVQEYGKGWEKYSKNQKLDLMHVGTCSVLMPFGYYSFEGRDDEGWPHFTKLQDLPTLNTQEQEQLVKKGILEYFTNFFEDSSDSSED
jgi:hypothetical protein